MYNHVMSAYVMLQSMKYFKEFQKKNFINVAKSTVG